MKKLFTLIAMLALGISATWAVDMTTMVGQLGLTDNSNGYYAYASKPVQLSAGTSYVYTFKNYNNGADGTAYYQCWVLNAWSGGNGFFLRADATGNGENAWGSFSHSYSGNTYDNVSSTVTDWLQAYNGVDVTLTITRSTDGTTVTVSHTAELAGDYTASGSTTYAGTQTVTGITSSDDIWFAITDEASHQIISNVLYTAADGTKTNYSGVLNHTAQYASGKNTSGNSTDAEQQQYYYDNTKSTSYGGWAYADFNFTVPTGMTVSSANLTWSALNGSNGGSRDNIIYYLNAGTTFDYTNYGNYQSARTNITTVTWAIRTSTSVAQTATTDVTAAITALAASQSYAIFQWTGNAGGAKLYGMASASRPILEVVSTSLSKVDYTINYKNGETTVKTVTGSDYPDTEITASRKVTGDDEVTYLADDATLPSMTLASGTNELNVSVHQQKTATLKVTTTVGDDAASTETTNLYEADDLSCTWSYAFPLYKQNAAGVYYKTEATTFGEGGTFTDGQEIEKTVTYTIEASDVVYFCDASTTAGTNYTYSNGESGYVAAQNVRNRGLWNGTLAAGNYKFVVKFTAVNKRALVLRSGTADPFASLSTSSTSGEQEVYFTLDKHTSSVYINGANSGTSRTNQSEDFDYAIIFSVPTTQTVSVLSGRTFGTFSSAYNVDFSDEAGTDDLAAYTVTYDGDNDKLVLTRCQAVLPAGTGVVIYAPTDTKSQDFAVATSASALSVENAMVAVTTATTPTAEGDNTIYVLSADEFHPYSGTGDIAAGKAYLSIARDANSAKTALPLSFEDDIDTPTAINAIPETLEVTRDGKVYNLQGVQVGSLKAGEIYIMNGKKFSVNK